MERFRFIIDVSTNDNESRLLQELAFCNGWKWGGDKSEVFNFRRLLVFYPFEKRFYHTNKDAAEQKYLVNLEQGIDYLLGRKQPPEQIIIKDEVVEFKDNGDIKVGCTDVSFETITKIYERAKLSKNKGI